MENGDVQEVVKRKRGRPRKIKGVLTEQKLQEKVKGELDIKDPDDQAKTIECNVIKRVDAIQSN